MEESTLYGLGSAFEDGPSYRSEPTGISRDFYEDAVKLTARDDWDELQHYEVDNVVVDPNVPVSAMVNSSVKNDFGTTEKVRSSLEDITGDRFPMHWDPVEQKFYEEITPSEAFYALGSLKDAEVFYPEHTSECVNGAAKALKHSIRENDLQYDGSTATAMIEAEDDVNEFRNKILSALSSAGTELHVMREYGIFENYKNADFDNKNVTEDDLIREKAEELDGFTVVATYDGDFAGGQHDFTPYRDVVAVPPNLLADIWGRDDWHINK